MVELFAGKVFEKIIDAGFEYLKDGVTKGSKLPSALQRLQEIKTRIQAVVCAANLPQIRDHNQKLNEWLWQLRDAIEEADDLLDEFDYLEHKERVVPGNTEETKKRNWVSIIKSLPVEGARKFRRVGERLKTDPNLERLEQVVQKLEEVSAGVGDFLHLFENTKQELQVQELKAYKTRLTGPLPTDDLIGRGEDKEFVIQWLKNPSNEHQTTFYRNISLLSIVGHGGMGKTTLVQHVYSEFRKDFDLKIWVCVSTNFDAQKVIADMLECIKKERPRAESLSTLQESLKSEVASKKFLLVLDDIWAEEEVSDKSKWKNVFAPLFDGDMGSKILITTREPSVASMIARVLLKKGEDRILTLKGLEEDKCLQLLYSEAFANVESFDDHEDLKSIGGKIVKKLSGSPLAAKVIGGALSEHLDKGHWLSILNSDIIQAEPDQSILSVLRLSYIFLPKHLQICFAFCCIFSQDHEFDKNDLVRMWIALGFIQPFSYNQEETLEDIGGGYFDILVRKSFFDKFQDDSKTYYKMHDLLHELAQSVSVEECFRIKSDKEFHSRISETVRHLYVRTDNLEMLKKFQKFKHLRSLFLKIDMDHREILNVFAEIFKSMGGIRLLYIHHAKQYVSVFAKEDVFVDEGIILKAIENLIHLRYFKFDGKDITQMPLPRSLSKLYHLKFIIYDRMRVLPLPKDCPSLISLGGHQKVEITEKYQLILNDLSISDPSVLPMEPSRSITSLLKLRIWENDELVSFPYEVEQWFLQVSTSLCELEFENLKSLQSLPSSLESLTFLKRLNIRNIPELQVLPKLPDSLERLVLHTLKSLQCLPPSLSSMSALKRLDLADIPLLKSLPDLPPSLEQLELITLESLQCLPPSLSSMSALKSLQLSGIPLLKSLPDLPPSLESLYLDTLKSLQCLPPFLSSMSALKSLFLRDIPLLKSLPDLPPSLELLYIQRCHKELKERYDNNTNPDSISAVT